MTKGNTTWIQKDPLKVTAPNNYRPIMFLSIMWKILTRQIRKEMYYSLISCRLFLAEKKWCLKGTRELLWIDQHILNESKTRRKNLAMARINNKKANENVPQNLIFHCLKVYKIIKEVIQFTEKTMEIWRVELRAGGKSLAEVKIQRGMFQWDALSPLLLVIAMIPLNHILRKCTAGYKLSRSQENINHLIYMDGINCC